MLLFVELQLTLSDGMTRIIELYCKCVHSQRNAGLFQIA